MGGKSESQIKQQITNEMSMEITNITKNINNITNSATHELSQEIKNKAEAKVEIITSGSNIVRMGKVKITGKNSKVNIDQDMKIAAVSNAFIKILTDTSQKQDTINAMADKIKNKIDNDSNIKQDVDFLAKVGSVSSTNGGPEGMVNALADTVKTLLSSVSGSSSSSNSETNIRNTIKTQLNNTTLNETNTSNKISTSIKNSMEQLGEGVCKQDTAGLNLVEVDDLTVEREGEYNVDQKMDISSFSSCIIDLQLGSKLVSALTNDFKLDIGADTTNKTSSDQKGKVDIDAKNVKTADSSIMKSVDNAVGEIGKVANNVVGEVGKAAGKVIEGVGGIMQSWIYIVGGVIFLIIIIIGGSLFSMGGSGSSKPVEYSPNNNEDDDNDVIDDNDDNDDDDDIDNDNVNTNKIQKGGGINGNIYLFASFIAIFMLISRKSLPLCGVLLIVIILYFVHIKKLKI